MAFVLTLCVFLAVIAMMAIGVMFKRKSIQGSCGGLSTIGVEKECNCETTCENHRQLYQIQEPSSTKQQE
ncbi:(Na+)-NQR maturation NqrM [Vibrio tritonius]|uniref:(Na+)-NQR maturation NqrM n=2 Tax=Vibrio tritonius TaxID=1435069 RepID=A0ABS7YV83_9VIBR|nr:(Na+)-NQR maturation NqrM [Vibrio tritonius]MCA2018801.1 (Na+)-NQR maturation NqrM [Vibrio tritonius]